MQFVDGRAPRVRVVDAVAESGSASSRMEHVVPVGTERMRITETVAGDFVAFIDVTGSIHAHRQDPVICYRRSIPDNARSITTASDKWRSTSTQ